MSVAKLAKFSTGPFDGRDKVTKFTQFAAKFLAYNLAIKDPTLATKLSALDKQLALARKGLRFGKSIEVYQKLVVCLGADHSNPVNLALEVIGHVGMMFRWGYDNLSFLEKVKLLSMKDPGLQANQWRTLAGIAYTIQAILDLFKTHQAVEKADEKDKPKAEKARQEAFLQFIAKGCDLINALHGAKIYLTSDGTQGICGMVNSVISLRKTWSSIK